MTKHKAYIPALKVVAWAVKTHPLLLCILLANVLGRLRYSNRAVTYSNITVIIFLRSQTNLTDQPLNSKRNCYLYFERLCHPIWLHIHWSAPLPMWLVHVDVQLFNNSSKFILEDNLADKILVNVCVT